MLSDACADFLDELGNSTTPPIACVRWLLAEIDRYETYGYSHGEVETLRTACKAYLASHPGGNWRRLRLGSMVRLAVAAEQVRAFHDTPHPTDAAWLSHEPGRLQ